ncbi:hypothetical protein, partial [Psychromonas aquatilis]
CYHGISKNRCGLLDAYIFPAQNLDHLFNIIGIILRQRLQWHKKNFLKSPFIVNVTAPHKQDPV